ncbi:ABC transporter ATP-binding protein [Thalassovita mangrovi]|uniref:ATP-binding cassette domain-containing protein n=1 Tax=Thalassovita mangrovi TaxID=2692236 RepID=A0A6L8LM38_9RHOB|nr:ABC transporter ATP-binding protein [Thalassovita mangrovi]MYM56935.1 ATP-binding cassette domain-containing protein [Thalassovita mangrovi]
MTLLSLQNMQTKIEQYSVLHDVSFDVPEGGVFVLLGRNGAGKTTTLRSIMGLWKPNPGSVTFRDQDITGLHASDIAKRGIAFVPENMGIFGGLTVAENMILATANGKFDQTRLERIYTLFPALKKFWDKQAGTLSGGQKQMLAVSRAIIEPRELILIDEPTKGLAPAIVNAMAEAFREISANTTILLVEQNFEFARSLGRDMAVIDDGRVVHRGTMADFVADKPLQDRLLSLSMFEEEAE